MDKKLKNILFTGGTGLLSSVWAATCYRDYKITLSINSRLLNSKFVNYEIFNFENKKNLEKKIQKYNFKFIIHTLGVTDIEKCEEEPILANKINYIFTKNIVDVCKKHKIKLIFISSDQLYDGKKKIYHENDKCNPINVYGKIKIKTENYIKKKLKNYLIIRTNFFGKGPNYKKSYSDTIIDALKKKNVFYTPNRIYFSPISIYYLIKISMKLIQKGAVGIFNISSNERISKYNFAKKLAKEFRLNDKLIVKDKNFFISRQAKRPLNMALSNKKVKKFLEINIPSIRDQIKREIVASKKDIFKNFFINVQQYGSHYIDQQDINEVVKVLKSDSLTQGPKIFEFEEAIAKYVGSKYAVAVSSCTAGLHICGIVAGIKKNSNSITSPISFVSTANAITYNSGNILFCDIDPKDLNIDIIKLKKLIKKNKNIKAIFPVHFAGYPCNMKEIFELAKKKNITVIEDGAHSLGGQYFTGEKIGSCKFSDMCVFSLHPVKSIAAGEGGVITTNNEDYYRRLLRLRSHGINKLNDEFKNKSFYRVGGIANPWHYEMQELGYHYRITDIQAALALSQLKKIDKFVEKRRQLSKNYDESFKNFKNIRPVLLDNQNLSARHIYIVKIDLNKAGISRAELMQQLYSRQIGTQLHYLPITEQPYYKKYKKKFLINELKNAYNYFGQCLTIPLYYSLTFKQQKKIVNSLKEILE